MVGTKSPEYWENRFAELKEFIEKHRRHPSRHTPQSEEENSLAWWVKDQRRKMALGDSDTRKRGSLTDEQYRKLESVGVRPGRGRPSIRHLPDRPPPRKASPPRPKRPALRAVPPTPKVARVLLSNPAQPSEEGRCRPVWLKRLRALIEFVAEEDRLPDIHYKLPPHEVRLGRWLAEQLRALERYPRAFAGKRLSDAEHDLLLKSGFRVELRQQSEE